MTMPGFTAQASLGRVSGTYHLCSGNLLQPAGRNRKNY